MKYSRSLFVISIWFVAQGCDASKAELAPAYSSGCVGARCQPDPQNKEQYDILVGSAGAGVAGTTASSPSALPPLCSVQNPTCDPDDASSCNHVVPSIGAGGASYGTSSAGATNGSDDALANGGTSFGGATGQAGVGVALACRIQRDILPTRATCEPAGSGKTGAPCLSRANCAAGLACVEENGTAQCRPYCCRGVGSCPNGTYCDQRSTKELVAATERLTVSVCLPAVECRFDDPYPCPPDRTCSCPVGKACGVVRPDGTTACVAPGVGTEGQPCPCAAGHVCSGTLGSCFKVCSLSSSDPGCVDGFCQSSESLSSNWGICVGPSSLL